MDALGLMRFRDEPQVAEIVKYIERTNSNCLRKDINSDQLTTLYRFAKSKRDLCSALILAYQFGQAKGYRTRQQDSWNHARK